MKEPEPKHNVLPALLPHLVEIDSIKQHPNNPRQGDVGAIAESLERNGQFRVAVVQEETGLIIAGNHMQEAAKRLGWTHIAAIHVDAEAASALRIMLADNLIAERASWDEAALLEMGQLTLESGNEYGTGVDHDLLEDLGFRVGDVPEFAPAPAVELRHAETPEEEERRREAKAAYQQHRDLPLLIPMDRWDEVKEAILAIRKHHDCAITEACMTAIVGYAASLGGEV